MCAALNSALSGPLWGSSSFQLVPPAPDGDQVPRITRVRLDRVAQKTDIRIQGIQIPHIGGLPHLLEECLPGYQGSFLLNEVFQDLDTLGGKMGHALRGKDPLTSFIQADITKRNTPAFVQWCVEAYPVDKLSYRCLRLDQAVCMPWFGLIGDDDDR